MSKQDGLDGEIKRLGRSRYMLSRYDSRRSTLSDSKRRLLSDEQSQSETLETRVKNAVAEAFCFLGRDLLSRAAD
ncbi:MAG: hypothetical protein HC800_23470 [Phormidesmis sp. RL_2_1]|nr:hypothetical protein [Phormidesmis sp. RL_2_1]